MVKPKKSTKTGDAHRVYKGYRFRIYPNAEQRTFFAKMFGCNRFVWNYFLNERKEFYLANQNVKDGKRSLNYHDNARSLTQLKQKEETAWLAEVNAQSLQAELKQLDGAYLSFFRKVTAFPKFKTRGNNQSFKVPQHFKLDIAGNRLWLPKLKKAVKIVCHRQFGPNAEVLFVTVSKTPSGKYFASLCVEEDVVVGKPSQNNVGIDVGLTDFATLSTGEKITNPKIAWKQRKKLKFLHRRLSRKVKGSSNRNKARIKLARQYERITNRKQDFSHKLSRRIVDENQVIAVEDPNVVGMQKNRRLARSIGEVSWSEFLRQLEYKAGWQRKTLVKVGRFFPSSKLCSCGFVNQNLRLKDRKWQCPKCGVTLDRDINAATNILKQGLNLLAEEPLINNAHRKAYEKARSTNKLLSKLAKASKDTSGEGLPSDALARATKQKLGEALVCELSQDKERSQVREPRSPKNKPALAKLKSEFFGKIITKV